MDISDHVAVLDFGCKIADGPPDEVRTSPEVVAANLGVAHADPRPFPRPQAGKGMGGG